MERIAAAGNLIIEMQPDRWRLLANGSGPNEQVLLEAAPGKPVRYMTIFAHRRRLPDTGSMPADRVQRVVLGWSFRDQSWHLGLLLVPELAELRGSRWCELARWPDPQADAYRRAAVQAGEGLAGALGRPFNLVPPQPAATPTAPPRPLPPLPQRFDLWRLEAGRALTLKRAGRWSRVRLWRVIWYSLLAVVYTGLSVLTLQGRIALPNPAWLPYLGLAAAVLMLALAAAALYQLLVYPNTILVDERGVQAQRWGRPRWSHPRGDIQAVYVSQVVGKKGKKLAAVYGEINLLLQNGRFRRLFEYGEAEPLPSAGEPGIFPLDQTNFDTPLQAAGLYLARALEAPCYLDRRR